ncbi:MAG: hypothetical protein H6Q72_4889 [Firmicutes bacterium]|nr:hypothetical protein [Bacillota bacterium]
MKLLTLAFTILMVVLSTGICSAAGATRGEIKDMDRDVYGEERIIQAIAARTTPEFGKAVAAALESVEKHPYHHLERGLRADICQKMSEYDQGHYGKPPANSSRVWIAEKQLALVKPLWKQAWKDDATVDDLIDAFNRVSNAETREDKAALLADWEQKWKKARGWTQQTWLKDTQHQLQRFPESLVGLSAAASLVVAGEGAIQPEQASHIFEKDTPAEFWYEDMDFYAAAAYAGGLPYQMEGFVLTAEPDKYRRYWRWWLLEALPDSLANIQRGYIGIAADWGIEP